MTSDIRSLRLGACLSLSGKHARFGTQAQRGLQIWQEFDGSADLIIEDDESNPEVLEARLRQLADKCDILLGPYSTQLMRRAGNVAASLDRLLWNHGGSGDDVEAAHPGYVVSVLTPTSRYAEPFVRHIVAANGIRPLWIAEGKGRFGRQVADGAEKVARALGVPTLRLGPDEELPQVAGEWTLFCAGAFEEDIARVRRAKALANPPCEVGTVAAGVREFGDAVDYANGVYGVGQWFPGSGDRAELSMRESEFVAAYGERAKVIPDYPAVQAAAAAILASHCARQVGSVERVALWCAAQRLETTTMFGAFKIDPRGVQIGHLGALVRWIEGGIAAVRRETTAPNSQEGHA